MLLARRKTARLSIGWHARCCSDRQPGRCGAWSRCCGQSTVCNHSYVRQQVPTRNLTPRGTRCSDCPWHACISLVGSFRRPRNAVDRNLKPWSGAVPVQPPNVESETGWCQVPGEDGKPSGRNGQACFCTRLLSCFFGALCLFRSTLAVTRASICRVQQRLCRGV